MKKRMNKDELLEQIKVKHRQLERYIFYFERGGNGAYGVTNRPKFDLEEMEEPGVVGEWSLKDVLAHLTDWEQRFIDWYEAGLRGGVSNPPVPGVRWDDLDALAEEGAEEYQERPLELVLDEFPRSYQHILVTVQSISQEDLFTSGRYGWAGDVPLADYVVATTYEHYDWAKKRIRRWRRTHANKQLNKDVILERMQVERRQLEKNLAELTEEEMVEGGVIGEWSVKDVLAHLIDWEQRFLGWYEAGLQGEVPETPAPGVTWGELHILNQQIFEKHRNRPLDDILAEFQASYQRVLATIQELSEEDMFQVGLYAWTGTGNIASYIRANTSNHYRWAKVQIRKWLKARNKL